MESVSSYNQRQNKKKQMWTHGHIYRHMYVDNKTKKRKEQMLSGGQKLNYLRETYRCVPQNRDLREVLLT